MLKRANPPHFAALNLSASAANVVRQNQLAGCAIAGIAYAGLPQAIRRWAYADLCKRSAGAASCLWRPRRSPHDGRAGPRERFRTPFMPVARNRLKLVRPDSRRTLKTTVARGYIDSKSEAPAIQQASWPGAEYRIFKPAADAVPRTGKHEPVERPTPKPKPNLHGVRRGGLRP